jgi:hypothetical protein
MNYLCNIYKRTVIMNINMNPNVVSIFFLILIIHAYDTITITKSSQIKCNQYGFSKGLIYFVLNANV